MSEDESESLDLETLEIATRLRRDRRFDRMISGVCIIVSGASTCSTVGGKLGFKLAPKGTLYM